LQQSIINYQKKERKYQQKELETQNLTLKVEKATANFIWHDEMIEMELERLRGIRLVCTNQNSNDRP